MRFIDEAEIKICSGKGGAGLVSFHRERFMPKGGPDGGDGGRGGSIIFKADPSMKTLLDYRLRREYRAEDGKPGGKNRKKGRDGKDCILRVPVGTVIKDKNGEVLADLSEPDMEVVLLRGGRGGKGNARFALPHRQAPDFCSPPGEGIEMIIRLELKLIADIGIVGLPNAGKSTLINTISRAKAKVADYPFTTMYPNLGVVSFGPDTTFTVADMPGLIKGSAEGAGIGHRFLKHCERVKALVHLVDASDRSGWLEALETVEMELAKYDQNLLKKPRAIFASKIDCDGAEHGVKVLKKAASIRKIPFVAISSLTGQGIEECTKVMWQLLSDKHIQNL